MRGLRNIWEHSRLLDLCFLCTRAPAHQEMSKDSLFDTPNGNREPNMLKCSWTCTSLVLHFYICSWIAQQVYKLISVYLSKKVIFLTYAKCLHSQRGRGNQVKEPPLYTMCSYSCQFSLSCWRLISINVHHILSTHKKYNRSDRSLWKSLEDSSGRQLTLSKVRSRVFAFERAGIPPGLPTCALFRIHSGLNWTKRN